MPRLILTSLLLLLLLPLPMVEAQSPIHFGDTHLENDFPDELAFEVEVESDAGEIVSARLYHALRNATSTTQVALEFEPAGRVTLRYTWNTSGLTIPPGAPIFYHWEVTDSAGNRASSEEALFYYDDARYDWQVLENESIGVWWHDRPAEFGEQVFEIAQRAVGKQRSLFKVELDYPMRVIINNDQDEFTGWHPYVHDWVGGQAFTSLGVTVQIVSAYSSQEMWLNGVIPHEIAHLYFYQVTYHPLSSPPTWFNEGVAQYNEFVDHDLDLSLAKSAILRGDLIPLRTLIGSFGNDRAKVSLAYAESLSAVTYLVEIYGAQGLSDLMAAYGEGKSNNQAFQAALGRTTDEFEADWLACLGVPEGMYVVPTPWSTPTWPPSPTMMSGLSSEEDVPPPATPAPLRSGDYSRTPTPASGADTPTPEPTAKAQVTSPPLPTPAGKTAFSFNCCLCPSAGLPAVFLLLVLVGGRRVMGNE